MTAEIRDILNEGYNLNTSIRNEFDLGNYESSKYTLAIYGAGNVGSQVFEILKSIDIQVDLFIDKSAKDEDRMFGKPILQPNSKALVEINKNKELKLVVIICGYFLQQTRKEIVNFLKSLGYKNIINDVSLVELESLFFNKPKLERYNQIEKVFELLQDECSRKVFCSNLKAHSKSFYDETIINKELEQYFNVEVPFSKGYDFFIDCGAFTGDSLKKLLKNHSCRNYIGFEPDRINYKKLVQYSKRIKNQNINIQLYPCAIIDKLDYINFEESNNSCSMINESGNDLVQAVSLDEVLIKSEVTMIKMDIEGAEIRALLGAKNLITTNKPDLAICVYHKVSDLWKIPLLLQHMVPEYKFYLRAHEKATIETVLYATV